MALKRKRFGMPAAGYFVIAGIVILAALVLALEPSGLILERASIAPRAEVPLLLFPSDNAFVTLSSDRVLAGLSNPRVGRTGCIYLRQDEAGGHKLAYDSAWMFPEKIAPALSSRPRAVDQFCYVVMSSNYARAVLTKDVR